MNLEGTTGDIDKIVADMKEIAELGLKESPPVRFAYEALAWGAHLDLYVHPPPPPLCSLLDFGVSFPDGNKSGT